MHRSAARATALLAVHSGRTPTASEPTAMAGPAIGARVAKASGHSDLVPGKSGFPCRFGDCHVHFAVLDRSSMASLLAASEERTAHELAEHGYHHIVPVPAPTRPLHLANLGGSRKR